MVTPTTEPKIKLGVTVRKNQSIWAVGMNRAFYEGLPEKKRRMRMFIGSDKMMLKFGEVGVVPYAKHNGNVGTTMWVQIGPLHTNMLPRNFRHRGVRIKGEFDQRALSYVFEVPPFVKFDELARSPGMRWLSDKLEGDERALVSEPPAAEAIAEPAVKTAGQRVADAPIDPPATRHLATVGLAGGVAIAKSKRRPPLKWQDNEVHRLLERLRDCLIVRTDIEVTINEDRSVTAKRTIDL